MKPFNRISIIFILMSIPSCQPTSADKNDIAPSYFKLTTSNGLVVAIYNAAENRIDDVYPHIFACYDSAKYVHPFIGNLKLKTDEIPVKTSYLENTHVIDVQYKDFSINYFTSFTRNDRVFYIVARGEREKIENLYFEAETGSGNLVSGITLLENHLQNLPILIKGRALTGNFSRPYDETTSEKYFLYSLTDSLFTDTAIISRTIAELKEKKLSLVDNEVKYMKSVFNRCNIPEALTVKERSVVEQSVSILKMAQVSDAEIFPFSPGQVLAALRPGLWHVAWVRDGSYAIQAMTRLGMYEEARKALDFMLKAPSGKYKHYVYSDGKDYGPGVDYQVSLTRYFGNGTEECDYNEYGPNVEYDDFGLFLCAFTDYVNRTNDKAFYMKWNETMCTKVADATVAIIDTNSLVRADSGPWEHHLQMTKQYAFTSGVCARGLELFAGLQEKYGLPFEKYRDAAVRLKKGILSQLLVDGSYIKGNASDMQTTDHEYYDGGSFEMFANGLIPDKELFRTHMAEYNNVMRIQGDRPGYIRLNSADPYENQEWVFINLRIALAHLLFGQKPEAHRLIGFVTEQAAVNYNIIPEMYSNKIQMEKVPEEYYDWNTWCNCIRQEDNQYIGAIPMVGYGSGAYILALYSYYGD